MRWYVCFLPEVWILFWVGFRQKSNLLDLLRHSKAMSMLKAGIPLIYIRDFLGHVNINTTEVYARADNETKRKYLEQSYDDLNPQEFPDWSDDKNLMGWLNGLCQR